MLYLLYGISVCTVTPNFRIVATVASRYGFDTKFASNLIRLILEGKELVSTGEIVFPLAYKQTILDIKQGLWTIKEVLDYAEQLEAETDVAVEKSDLPSKPRFDEIEQFTIQLLENHLMGG